MYSFTSKIRYSETDMRNRLKVHSLVNYFQDCSTFQSESIGKGVEWLKAKHRVWVLNAWQIDIVDDKGLCLGEDIRVGTWMYDYRGTMASRNFIMENLAGKRLVNANAIWVLMDTETMRPIRINDEDVLGYDKEDRIDMEYRGRKISLGENCVKAGEPFPVIKGHLDSNNHVNNANYFLMAEEFMPSNLIPRHLRAEYRKSAILGDTIYPWIEMADGGCVIRLCDEQMNPFALVEMLE